MEEKPQGPQTSAGGKKVITTTQHASGSHHGLFRPMMWAHLEP